MKTPVTLGFRHAGASATGDGVENHSIIFSVDVHLEMMTTRSAHGWAAGDRSVTAPFERDIARARGAGRDKSRYLRQEVGVTVIDLTYRQMDGVTRCGVVEQ